MNTHISAESSYYLQKRPEMVEFVPDRRARVLDVGCAEGHFAASLPGVAEAWGIEPTPAAEAARGRLHRVLASTFEEAEPELPAHYFDVVICNDSIEHMPDHDWFLSRITRYIAPGGALVASIPNVRFYNNLFQMVLEKDWNYTEAGILDRTHMRFFTEKSLRKCLQRHGFTITKFKGLRTNMHLGGSFRSKVYGAMSKALIAGTLGYFSDIQYLQFGIRAVKNTEGRDTL